MVDKICDFLTNKIREEDGTIDDERAEIIQYGVELIVGEIPKLFIMIAIAILLGVGKLALISFLIILPYRKFSGGFHLKTHIGCIVCTSLIYIGTAFLANYLPIVGIIKYISIICIWIFGIILITKYAPADTENVPIISKKERKRSRNASYIVLTIELLVSIFIPNDVIASIIIYGMLIQTITITRLAYKLTNNKYGHEVYMEEQTNLV